MPIEIWLRETPTDIFRELSTKNMTVVRKRVAAPYLRSRSARADLNTINSSERSRTIAEPVQKLPATVNRTASGSAGCTTVSMTPVWQTAAGGGLPDWQRP